VFELQAVLRDGTPVTIRPVVPADKQKLEEGMSRLSPVSRRQRFFSSKEHLGDELLAHLTEVDYSDHFAWLALAVDEPGEPIVGVGRYVRVPEVDDLAEVAFVVGEPFQRKGLATLFLELLGVIARSHGINRFQAYVLADNIPMRELLSRLGAQFHQDEAGVLQTIIDIPPPPGTFAPVEVLRAGSRFGARMSQHRLVAGLGPLDRLGRRRPDGGGSQPRRMTG